MKNIIRFLAWLLEKITGKTVYFRSMTDNIYWQLHDDADTISAFGFNGTLVGLTADYVGNNEAGYSLETSSEGGRFLVYTPAVDDGDFSATFVRVGTTTTYGSAGIVGPTAPPIKW